MNSVAATNSASNSLPNPYYTIRKLDGATFEVCKWGLGEMEPEACYRVMDSSWAKCTCPSYKNPCKHMRLVRSVARERHPELPNLAFTEDGQAIQLAGL